MHVGMKVASVFLTALALAGPVTAREATRPSTEPGIQLAQAGAASRWKAGGHYAVIKPAQPTSTGSKIEVIEVFWYGCPHCRELEPYLKAWEAKKPSNVEFIRVPATWGPWHMMHARLYYSLVELNRADLHDTAFREAYFSETLLLGEDIPATERIHTSFARRHGIEESAFKAAYNSDAVLNKVKQADELIRRYKLDSVPKIIINGKYMADVASAGGQSQLISLINDLVAQEKR